MMITRLMLNHFRNFVFQEFHFSPGFNWIVGPNGSGKTACLEAIYLLSTGRSHRSSMVSRLIHQEAPELTIFVDVEEGSSHHAMGLSRHRTEMGKLKLDHRLQDNHLEVAKLLPVLMLDPEGFGLFTGGSKARRSVMDFGVFHAKPEFYTEWSTVKRILAQRNAGLKSGVDEKILALFEAPLIKASEKLDQYRAAYVQELKTILTQLVGDFLASHEVSLSYFRGWAKDESLKDLLNLHLAQDRVHGFTSHGPHRADLRFRVGKIPVQDVLSRGEQKLLICAIKMAQGILFQKQTGKQPIVLVDDLASELDTRHQEILLNHLKTLGAQTFLTAIDPSWLKEGRVNVL